MASKNQTILLIKIMQDFVDGKVIEAKCADGFGVWREATAPTWNFRDYDYRVKPNPPIRPWNNSELLQKVGTAIMTKDKLHSHIIINVYPSYEDNLVMQCVLGAKRSESIILSSERLLADFTLLDGSPCGVVEQN